MRQCTQSVVRSFLILILIGTSAMAAPKVRPTGASVPGEVLVRIQAGASAAAITSIKELADADDGQRIATLKSGAAIWRLHSRSRNAEALTTALAKNPHVEYAEPNYILSLVASPNDTYYTQLWGLKNTGQTISGSTGFAGSDIDAEPAWTVTTGSSSVVVGIVDTGIDYNHPDLAANMWSNPGGKGNVVCGAGTHGFNSINKTCDPMDDHDHGTHVAGTIGAVGNNNLGVTGVNWSVSLMALKFIGAGGYGTTADAIAAINFAVQAKIDGVNVRVLSNSWGGGAFSKALLDVINKANENGILFVAAAGNDGTSNDLYPHYPSNYASENMISVAATENRDGLAYFSNYGVNTVHLGAPGVSVLSTTIGNSYSYFSGTSMATPHVAGVAALILARTPGLTTDEVKETILDSTDPIPSLAGKTRTGGRLNAARAVGATVPPEFTLAISPLSRTVARGASTTYTVTVIPSSGFAGSVALSTGALPTGVTASFSPVSTTTTSTLTITTSNTTPTNVYTVGITGVSGALTRNAGAGLTVLTTAPAVGACPQFASSTQYAASTPTAVATGDFNRDGRPDVAATSVEANVVSVRLGQGNGTLQPAATYSVGTAPIALAAGDVNGDGRIDFAVANSGSDDVSILLGNGEGTFTSSVAYAAGSSPFAVAIADFDNDGKSDLAVGNNSGSTISILTGAGDGTFDPAVHYAAASGPFGVTVGDFDRDGNADVAVASYNAGKVSVLLGNGDATFAAAVHYNTAAGASAVATGDFNGDGSPDLAVSNHTANNVSILLGNGSGTFLSAVHYAVGSGPYSVAVGDLNGDGKSDLAVANANSDLAVEVVLNSVSILLGTGTGTFLPDLQIATGGYEPNHLSLTDLNNDGKTDIVVANTGSSTITVIMNVGVCASNCNTIAAPALYAVTGTPHSLTAGDFDRDGILDIAAATRGANSVSIVLGNGDGTFYAGVVAGVGTNPDSITSGDFDRDGDLDLAVANSGSGNASVLLGNGDGTFASAVHYTAGTTPRSIVTADFNRDGDLDLVMAIAGSNGVALLLGNGNGTFQAPSSTAAGTTPFFAAPGDFNRDGKMDLAVANFGSANVSILIGNGNGTFQPATNFAAGTGPRSIAVHDLNGDGKLDLAVANATSNNVSVLMGNGNGTFQTAVHHAAGTGPFSVTAGDLNHDGRLDLAVANNASGDVSVLVGDGAGFSTAVNSPGGSAPAGIIAADVNGDGKPDLAIAASGSSNVVILRNTCPSPDLTVTKTHSGAFTQGSSGKTYSIVVTNSGAAPTVGAVTVTDTLPAGLSATGISGSGWTCTLGTLSCTRSDALASGASYPAITLTVRVLASAAGTVTNVVNVTGGGERNTINNSASDPTTITAVIDLIVISTHSGSFAQGATGKTYSLLVRNAGGLPTSGTVTVTDVLPASLTATAMAGTGWTCTLATRTCTRSNVLAGGAIYPAITLTVNVAANAPASVVNTATVSGGGQSNTSNDTTTDPTVIWASQTCGSFGMPTFYNTGSTPNAVAVANLNADALPDLVVTNYYSANISVLLGKPDGSFHNAVNFATGNYPHSLVLDDLSGDGNVDIVVVNSSYYVSVLLGNGAGAFAAPVTYNVPEVLELVAGDFDRDGKTDVAVSKYYNGKIAILRGNGDGTLQSPVEFATGYSPAGLAVSDVDRNGTSDLIVARDTNAVSVHLGNGDGTFGAATDFPTDSSAYSVATGDFDQDGKPDLAVPSRYYGLVTILLGNGDGTFQAGTSYNANTYSSLDILAEDIDSDGKTDLLLSNNSYTGIAILRGNGDGTFQDGVFQQVGGPSSYLALSDFNADGRPDLAFTGNYSYDVGILLGGCADLTIDKNHTGNFVTGQKNVYYTIAVENSGIGSSIGTVTVTDVLPDGLTATSISGPDWNCTLATLTCTTTGSVPAGGNFSTIIVGVDVDHDAPPAVVNTATVSGGGDSNAANNSASDPTTILQVPDLTVAKTHNGLFAQGQIGRTYTIVVSNAGSSATIGTVTVFDSLPTGLTPTEMTGAGWDCNVQTRTCTRSDELHGNRSYPAISLTVNVASNAPSFVTNYVNVSGGGESNQTFYNNADSDYTEILGTPENLVATAVTTSAVNLTWSSTAYAISYEVYKSPGPNMPFVLIANPISTYFSDTAVAANKTYVYRVRAVGYGTLSAFSNTDLATTIFFTDDPIVAGGTVMKALHINELRQAVNAVRAAAGLPPSTFTDTPVPVVSPIKAVYWNELRHALDLARSALGVVAIGYPQLSVSPGQTVKASHVRDLRSGVK